MKMSKMQIKFVKDPHLTSAYFWTFRQYDRVNGDIIFSSSHENITSLKYLEAILDNVSVTIAT